MEIRWSIPNLVWCILPLHLYACDPNLPFHKRSQAANNQIDLNGEGTPQKSAESQTTLYTESSNSKVEGGQTSGGGPGVICRSANGDLQSVEPLDLYEGRILRGLSYPAQPGGRDEIIALMVSLFSFSDAISRDLPRAIAVIKDHWHTLPDGVGIHTMSDLGNDYAVVKPEGCNIEPIGYYERDGSLIVAPSLYDALSPINQAAFVLHEALYYLMRQFKHYDNSKKVRELVATVFSNPSEETLRRYSKIITWPDSFITAVLDGASGSDIIITIDNPTDQYASFDIGCGGSSQLSNEEVIVNGSHSFVLHDPKNCRWLSVNIRRYSGNDPISGASYRASLDQRIFAAGTLDHANPNANITLYFE